MNVTIDDRVRYQTMQGFGGTMFDWGLPHAETPMLAGVPREVQEEAMRLAYTEVGLTRARVLLFDHERPNDVPEPFDPES